jgi:hypothetical protein
MKTLRDAWAYLMHAGTYVKGRMREGSTYKMMLASMASVAVLPAPFSYLGFGLCIAMAMAPNPPKDGQ